MLNPLPLLKSLLFSHQFLKIPMPFFVKEGQRDHCMPLESAEGNFSEAIFQPALGLIILIGRYTEWK